MRVLLPKFLHNPHTTVSNYLFYSTHDYLATPLGVVSSVGLLLLQAHTVLSVDLRLFPLFSVEKNTILTYNFTRGIPTPIRQPDCSNQSVFSQICTVTLLTQYARPIHDNHIFSFSIYDFSLLGKHLSNP